MIVVVMTDRNGKRISKRELPPLSTERDIDKARRELFDIHGTENYVFVNKPKQTFTYPFGTSNVRKRNERLLSR